RNPRMASRQYGARESAIRTGLRSGPQRVAETAARSRHGRIPRRLTAFGWQGVVPAPGWPFARRGRALALLGPCGSPGPRRDYFAAGSLMPFSRTTRPQRASSSFRMAANSAGVLATGIAPDLISLS